MQNLINYDCTLPAILYGNEAAGKCLFHVHSRNSQKPSNDALYAIEIQTDKIPKSNHTPKYRQTFFLYKKKPISN